MAGFNEVGQRALDEATPCQDSGHPSVGAEIEHLGAALLIQSRAEPAVVEQRLRTALAAARNGGALALEVRAAADLRRLELASGRSGDAQTILRTATGRFTEGHDLADLRDAQELLR
jgi:hypothetical protein